MSYGEVINADANQRIDEFSSMELSRPIMRAINLLGWGKPTPIQSATIPVALTGNDICACAATGTGVLLLLVLLEVLVLLMDLLELVLLLGLVCCWCFCWCFVLLEVEGFCFYYFFIDYRSLYFYLYLIRCCLITDLQMQMFRTKYNLASKYIFNYPQIC